MGFRFSLSLRRSLLAGSMAATIVAMALVFVVLAAFSTMCAAAEPDESPEAAAGAQTAASAPDAPDVPDARDAPDAPHVASGRPNQSGESNAAPPGDARAAVARPASQPRVSEPSRRDTSNSSAPRDAKPEATPIPVPPETASVTQHSIRLDGRKIDYTATAGNLLLRDRTGQATRACSISPTPWPARHRRRGRSRFSSTAARGPAACS